MPASSPSNPPSAAGAAASAVPAYASAPRRIRTLYALAALLVLGALGGVASLALRDRAQPPGAHGSAPASLADEARNAREAARAALEEASRHVLRPATPLQPEGLMVRTPDPTAGIDTGSVPEVPAEPWSPDSPRAGERVVPAPPAERLAVSPLAAAPEPGHSAPGGAAVEIAGAEVWAQMRAELARCTNTSVIPRVVCVQRVRARYCDGHWGSVPECPGGS